MLEDQLDPLQPGTAPLTAARYVASTLNHLANELITSADYPAALRTLVFSRAVCTHELQVRSARWQGPNARGAHDSDTNEVRCLAGALATPGQRHSLRVDLVRHGTPLHKLCVCR